MNYSNEQKSYRKKNLRLRKISVVAGIILVLLATIILLNIFYFPKQKTRPTFRAMKNAWKTYDYAKVYEISKALLEVKPFNNTALVYHGYSSFYLGVSSLDTSESQNYLDEAINHLRLALTSAKRSLLPQAEYMLGKCYFYKNTQSSYYYADLACKYLESAKKHGSKAEDIAEYLGLSYAALGMTMESIASFSEALLTRESNALLFSIAEQYFKAGQFDASRQYLFRVIENASDEMLVLQSRMLLGIIYTNQEKYDEARTEFEKVLEAEKNPDAYYWLGVIYEKNGDIIKARANWRRTLQLEANHALALEKMNR